MSSGYWRHTRVGALMGPWIAVMRVACGVMVWTYEAPIYAKRTYVSSHWLERAVGIKRARQQMKSGGIWQQYSWKEPLSIVPSCKRRTSAAHGCKALAFGEPICKVLISAMHSCKMLPSAEPSCKLPISVMPNCKVLISSALSCKVLISVTPSCRELTCVGHAWKVLFRTLPLSVMDITEQPVW